MLEGVPDPEVLAFATQQNRILVNSDLKTMPRHFGRFLEANGQCVGVFLVKGKHTRVGSAFATLNLQPKAPPPQQLASTPPRNRYTAILDRTYNSECFAVIRPIFPKRAAVYDNKVVAGEQERNIRLFVDADGRLSDLLSKLNIETTEVRLRDPDVGKARGFAFVEMSDTEAHEAILELQGAPAPRSQGSPSMPEPSKSSEALELIRTVNRLLWSRPARKHAGSRGHTPVPARRARSGKRTDVVTESLLVHAVDTFGSERTALEWLSTECGALNNRTPLQVIQERNEAEIERILDCIDFGMLA